MNQLANLPPVKWASVHPRLAAWIVLSAGMVILLAIEARNVGLQFGQWIALIVATVLVAGLCIWIVSWEDADETDGDSTAGDSSQELPRASDAAASPDTASASPSTPAEEN